MYWWEYVDAEDGSMGESERFESSQSAEEWLAREWESLLQQGIAEVLLHQEEGGEDVSLYRMSLGPQEAP